jgi:HEAT repeat protein
LSAPSETVRQCAALAIGKLQMRRALVDLLNQLETEESPTYAEMARAFGDFGAPALRSVVRVLPTSERPDRLVLALAHLANHGSAREVEKLENDPDSTIAQAARKAMARRARMEWEDLSVREQRTLTDASPAARLSQAFYAEASKVAI